MKKDKSGFTIIEVVLVLAIAGLIFLMVFIALPALQRSQRDTQRRNDVSRVATALTQYQANHGGNLPSGGSGFSGCSTANVNPFPTTKVPVACQFIRDYLNPSDATENEFVDPSGAFYTVALYGDIFEEGPLKTAITNFKTSPTDKPTYPLASTIYIFVRATCNGEYPEYTGNLGDTGKYAIALKLEGAGTICIDNS